MGYVCSGGLEDLRNGGGGWNLGTTSAAWLLPFGGAGAVVHTCRSLRELAAGFVRSTGRKKRRRGLEPGDDVGGAALALGRRWRCLPRLPVPHELAAGFVRATGRKERQRGLKPGG